MKEVYEQGSFALENTLLKGDDVNFSSFNEDSYKWEELALLIEQSRCEMEASSLEAHITNLLPPATIRLEQLPSSAEKLLLAILPKEAREALLGDLEEDFRGIAAKHGWRYACRWYWFQAISLVIARLFDVLMSAAERVAGLWKKLG